jgi:hypothetical protein
MLLDPKSLDGKSRERCGGRETPPPPTCTPSTVAKHGRRKLKALARAVTACVQGVRPPRWAIGPIVALQLTRRQRLSHTLLQPICRVALNQHRGSHRSLSNSLLISSNTSSSPIQPAPPTSSTRSNRASPPSSSDLLPKRPRSSSPSPTRHHRNQSPLLHRTKPLRSSTKSQATPPRRSARPS